MRYINKKHIIQSSNLNNSLAFYRALFQRMPQEITVDGLVFVLDDFDLEVRETVDRPITKTLILKQPRTNLDKVYGRMRKFFSLAQLRNDCEKIQDAIGLIDPDGNKWIIGDPMSEVDFQKCYFNTSFN